MLGKINRLVLSLILSVLGAQVGHAATPLRSTNDLFNPKPQKVFRLASPKVLVLFREPLIRDFPVLTNRPDSELRKLLAQEAGVISATQTRQTTVNTRIQIAKTRGQKPPIAFRPQAYGRALVIPFLDGFLDVKGLGSRDFPEQVSHGNGLLTLAEALRECLVQRAVDLVFSHAGYEPGTVECYGVEDLGFDVTHPDGSQEPAGAVIRAARKRLTPTGTTRGPKGDAIEAHLRKYGIASDFELANYEWQTIDHHNVQADAEGAMFDFGSVLVMPYFQRSPVELDRVHRLEFETWGYSLSSEPHPRKDNMRIWARRLADQWREGRLSPDDITAEYEKWLAPLRAQLFPCERALNPAP